MLSRCRHADFDQSDRLNGLLDAGLHCGVESVTVSITDRTSEVSGASAALVGPSDLFLGKMKQHVAAHGASKSAAWRGDEPSIK